MKIYIWMLIVLGGDMLSQCSSDNFETELTNSFAGDNSDGKEDDKYTSYWYYSYEAVQLLTAETLGLKEEFNPFTTTHLGDTLFVANLVDNSLLLIDLRTNQVMRTLRTWDFNGQEKSFGSQIEAIVPAGNRLYVAERQSRIHVFELPGLDYISCIGNGNYNGPVFQAQAMTVKDGLVFSRDKNGTVSIYKEEDVTPENYQKTARYRRTSNMGTVNNSFGTHSMILNEEGNILLTDFGARKIMVLDPALVNDDMQNNTSIALEDQTMMLGFNPTALTLGDKRLYATGNNAVHIYDREIGEWSKTLKSIHGYAFSQPVRIHAQNDSVYWVSDTHNSRKALVKMQVHKGEIREYERVSEHVVKVFGANTREGRREEYLVDLRTHEVISTH